MSVVAALAGGCGPSGREDAAVRPEPGGGTVVVIPAGSQVTSLMIGPGEAGRTTALGQAAQVESATAFPLVAYRRFCDGVSPAEFGLAEPRLTVDVRLPDGRPETLRVGGANFTGGGTYVLEPGSSCVDLVTTSSAQGLARLAGGNAADSFRPPPRLAPSPPGQADGPPPEPDPTAPWVEQVKRTQSRSGASAPEGGRTG